MLHLAGHGRHPGDNPLFSAVELADGPWFGYDIDQLPQTPSLVVLSACELGRVSVRSGEEAVGMSAAWLHAGARTVVSSPALVADDVACEVLAGWHHRVAEGEAPADALADAAGDLGQRRRPVAVRVLRHRLVTARQNFLRSRRITQPRTSISYMVKGDPVGCVGIGGFDASPRRERTSELTGVGPLRRARAGTQAGQAAADSAPGQES